MFLFVGGWWGVLWYWFVITHNASTKELICQRSNVRNVHMPSCYAEKHTCRLQKAT